MLDNRTSRNVFIDAGIENIHIRTYDSFAGNPSEALTNDIVIKNNEDMKTLFREFNMMDMINGNEKTLKIPTPSIYITGKLSEILQKIINRGECIMPAAALWAAAKYLLRSDENKEIETVGIIDLSASGYMVICVDKNEQLKDDLLIVNPRCGAGTGINLSRILEKLDIHRSDVDRILVDYVGPAGKEIGRAHV